MVAKLSGSLGLEVPVPVAKIYGGTGEVASNIIVQSARVDDGALATGTTVMIFDNTIPQNTEGDEYMAVSITPKNAANLLKVTANIIGGHSTASARVIVALYRDAIANALCAVTEFRASGEIHGQQISFTVVAGSIAATTFKIRMGADNAGTMTFNGKGGAAYFGGASNSFIEVTEVTP